MCDKPAEDLPFRLWREQAATEALLQLVNLSDGRRMMNAKMLRNRGQGAKPRHLIRRTQAFPVHLLMIMRIIPDDILEQS